MRLPDGEKGALLRVRGQRDPQTGGMQSFAGLTQVTIHGVAEGEEHIRDTFMREMSEELQEMLRTSDQPHDTHNIRTALLRHFPRQLHALARRDTGSERIITLGCLINEKTALGYLQPLLQARQLRIIRQSDLPRIRTINPSDPAQRDVIITPDDIAMFPDEYDALRRAFDMPHHPEPVAN